MASDSRYIAVPDPSNREQVEIPVTAEMVDAGLSEIREHHYDTDVRWMLECVFRAMAYANLEVASSIKAPK